MLRTIAKIFLLIIFSAAINSFAYGLQPNAIECRGTNSNTDFHAWAVNNYIHGDGSLKIVHCSRTCDVSLSNGSSASFTCSVIMRARANASTNRKDEDVICSFNTGNKDILIKSVGTSGPTQCIELN